MMSDTTSTISVQTIYSAEHAPAGAGSRLKIWGVISLLVAGGWLYVVWWPVWDWAQTPLMVGTIGAMPGMPASQPSAPSSSSASDGQAGLNDLSALLGGDPIAPPTDATDDPDQATLNDKSAAENESTDAEKTKSSRPSKSKGKSKSANTSATGPTGAQAALVTGLVAWIIAPTLLGLWIAMAGAASLGGAVVVRRLGLVLAPLAIVALAGATWHIWDTTRWYESILPVWTKPVLVSLGGFFAIGVGLAVNRKALFLQRSGAVMVILSAGLTVAAFWAASRWGPSAEPTPLFYARVFGQQSAFGWITLIALRGLK